MNSGNNKEQPHTNLLVSIRNWAPLLAISVLIAGIIVFNTIELETAERSQVSGVVLRIDDTRGSMVISIELESGAKVFASGYFDTIRPQIGDKIVITKLKGRSGNINYKWFNKFVK